MTMHFFVIASVSEAIQNNKVKILKSNFYFLWITSDFSNPRNDKNTCHCEHKRGLLTAHSVKARLTLWALALTSNPNKKDTAIKYDAFLHFLSI